MAVYGRADLQRVTQETRFEELDRITQLPLKFLNVWSNQAGKLPGAVILYGATGFRIVAELGVGCAFDREMGTRIEEPGKVADYTFLVTLQ